MYIAQCETGVFCALVDGRTVHTTVRTSARSRSHPSTDDLQHGNSIDSLDCFSDTTRTVSSHSDYGSIYDSDSTMAENSTPGIGTAKSAGANGTSDTASSSAAGIPFYEKQRQHLKELIARRRALEKKLLVTEEQIIAKETDYLEATPSGNIVLGFDNYVKGANAAAAQRRKTGLADQNRVFSRSSVSYNPNAADAQTPGSTPAPTPMSSTFGGNNRDGTSGAPTPSSTAGGGGGRAGQPKKGKKVTAAAEDSETDGREAKKVRTSFGARK